MLKESMFIPLKSCIRTKLSIQFLLASGETVVCVNKQTGKTRKLAFKALYQNSKDFWLNPHTNWEYFLPRTVAENLELPISGDMPRVGITHETIDTPEEKLQETSEKTEESDEIVDEIETAGTVNLGTEYQRIEMLSPFHRIDLLVEFKKRLDDHVQKKAPLTEEQAEVLVTSSKDAALINRATLWEALKLGDEEARQFTQGVVSATRDMVKSTARLVDEEIFQHELVNRLIQRSNGTVVQHMTRVFLNGLSFLSYYNEQFRSTSLTNRIRIHFAKKYRAFYRRLLPHLHPEDVVLERVFLKGMQAVPEMEFHLFATGFLVHDIGKAESIEYHEGEAGYDRDIIVEHVKIGYQCGGIANLWSR